VGIMEKSCLGVGIIWIKSHAALYSSMTWSNFCSFYFLTRNLRVISLLGYRWYLNKTIARRLAIQIEEMQIFFLTQILLFLLMYVKSYIVKRFIMTCPHMNTILPPYSACSLPLLYLPKSPPFTSMILFSALFCFSVLVLLLQMRENVILIKHDDN
jgi:hypothetical protein